MRTLPIHIDRLAAALLDKGVKLKRNNLIEVAAAAFGYHNQNQFAKAADRGDLDPTPATEISLTSVSGRRMALITDDLERCFAVDAAVLQSERKADSFILNPYGGLIDLRGADVPEGLDLAGRQMHFAAIIHEYGHDLYCAATEEELKRKIADWCREYWSQSGIEGSYEDMTDEQVCETYFDECEEDDVMYFDSEDVKIPVAGPATPRSGPFVPAHFDMRSAYIVGRTTGEADDPVLYWSNEDGWVDSASATVFQAPLSSWPVAGVDAGSLFVVPLPRTDRKGIATGDIYLNRDGTGLDIVFLTNRECDVQGPEDHAAQAMPWIEPDEIDVGMGPQRTAEIGYAALVDGKVYLAPTIKAFHFDHEDSTRAMLENSQELQEYAAAIEPAIRAVGGMAMLEENSEAVMLTILIPLREAQQAPDLESWKAALGELLARPGEGAGILAQFRPQASMGDTCYDVDPWGSDRIDVSYEILLMGEEAARELHDSDDEAEALTEAIRAPEWIRNWEGPFGIHVRDAVAAHYGFSDDE